MMVQAKGTPQPDPSDPTSGEKPVWERREDEGQAAYWSFCQYRDADPAKRRIGDVDHMRGKPAAWKDKRGKTSTRTQLIAQWSTRYQWVARTKAYDLHQREHRAFLESEAMARDVEISFARRRRIRDESFDDVVRLKAVVARLEANPDLDARGLKELTIAREKLASVWKEAFYGLPTDVPGVKADDMTPELAEAFQAFLVARELGRLEARVTSG